MNVVSVELVAFQKCITHFQRYNNFCQRLYNVMIYQISGQVVPTIEILSQQCDCGMESEFQHTRTPFISNNDEHIHDYARTLFSVAIYISINTFARPLWNTCNGCKIWVTIKLNRTKVIHCLVRDTKQQCGIYASTNLYKRCVRSFKIHI